VALCLLLALVPSEASSGCTDSAATNFDASADTDDGGCAYNCNALITNTGAPAGARCFIFADGKWPTDLTGAADEGIITVTPGEHWIVQGHPTGGPKLAPAVQSLSDTRFAVVGAGTALDLRYTGLDATASGAGPARIDECKTRACGGGVAASNAKIRIVGCTFSDTSASFGGAVLAVASSTVLIERSTFTKPSGTKGGALFVQDSDLTVLSSSFHRAQAQTQSGGGIWTHGSLVNISDCSFDHCTSGGAPALGDAVYLGCDTGSCQPVMIRGTRFQPFDKEKTAVIGGSWLATVGGCAEHPCEAGFSCSYQNYSLWCDRCPDKTVGQDGLTCLTCEAGKQAAARPSLPPLPRSHLQRQ